MLYNEGFLLFIFHLAYPAAFPALQIRVVYIYKLAATKLRSVDWPR